jgi:hypothetical protein
MAYLLWYVRSGRQMTFWEGCGIRMSDQIAPEAGVCSSSPASTAESPRASPTARRGCLTSPRSVRCR